MGKAISRATVMLLAGLVWVFMMNGDSFGQEQQLGGSLIESQYTPDDDTSSYVMAVDFAEPECLPMGGETGASWVQDVSLANVSSANITLRVQYVDGDVDDVLAPGESVEFEIGGQAGETVAYKVLYTFGDNPQESNTFNQTTPDKCLADPEEDPNPAEESAEDTTKTNDVSVANNEEFSELPEAGLNSPSALMIALGLIITGMFVTRRYVVQ